MEIDDSQPRLERRLQETFIVRYGISILLMALLITLGLQLPLGAETPWVLCFCGIALSALYGGLGPAIMSLLFSAAALSYLLATHVFRLSLWDVELENLSRFALFAMLALMTSCFIA